MDHASLVHLVRDMLQDNTVALLAPYTDILCNMLLIAVRERG